MRKNIRKLISKGLITVNGEHTNRTITITEKGSSFLALLTITISLWQIINKEGTKTKKSIISLITGIVTGLIAGFTTCLPLFL